MRRGRARRRGTGEPAPEPDIARQWEDGQEALRTCNALRFMLEQVMREGGPYAVLPAASVMRVLDVKWEEPRPPVSGTDPLAQFGFPDMVPQTGLDRVQEAVRKARGGPPPPPVQGYA